MNDYCLTFADDDKINYCCWQTADDYCSEVLTQEEAFQDTGWHPSLLMVHLNAMQSLAMKLHNGLAEVKQANISFLQSVVFALNQEWGNLWPAWTFGMVRTRIFLTQFRTHYRIKTKLHDHDLNPRHSCQIKLVKIWCT